MVNRQINGKALERSGHVQRLTTTRSSAQRSASLLRLTTTGELLRRAAPNSHAGGRWFDPSRAHSNPRGQASLAQPWGAVCARRAIRALGGPPIGPPAGAESRYVGQVVCSQATRRLDVQGVVDHGLGGGGDRLMACGVGVFAVRGEVVRLDVAELGPLNARRSLT